MEELAAFYWNAATKSWENLGKVKENKKDSTLSFTTGKLGFFGFFKNPDISTVVRAYPSPADFRKYNYVYFYLPSGKDLYLYTMEGMLVRHLSSAYIREYDVNRFVWDGKNQTGKTAKSGVYYFTGRDSTNWMRGKLNVIR
jgi:hypothetical protein